MSTAEQIVTDLRAESDELDALVADLPTSDWATATPAPGWTIAHQIAHLLWTDQVSLLAVTDEAGFNEILAQAMTNPTGFVDAGAEELALTPPGQLLADWRQTRSRLHDELLTVSDGRKLPWFGPPMSAASMATARMMETWAHGLDVADALGARRPATARLRSIAHIGVRTRDFAFTVHGLAVPADPFRVELVAPAGRSEATRGSPAGRSEATRGPPAGRSEATRGSADAGELWTWGPDDAAQRVTGSAEDFCMLVTQRRARSELDVTAVGADAAKWLTIAQAFAGPPGAGRG